MASEIVVSITYAENTVEVVFPRDGVTPFTIRLDGVTGRVLASSVGVEVAEGVADG